MLAHKLKGANAHMTFNHLTALALKIEKTNMDDKNKLLSLFDEFKEEYSLIQGLAKDL